MSIMNIITDKMVFGGNCLGKINGKNVFVPFSIPDEKIEVEIVQSKRDYDVAKIVNIIEPSPYRVTPHCPLYQRCGGCNLMHIDTEYQKKLRTQILKDTFERNGITVPEIEIISGKDFNYRCRFQFTNGGLSERTSNTIIPITNCPIAEEPINNWLKNTPFKNRQKGRCHIFGSEKIISENPNKITISSEIIKQKNEDFSKKNKNIKKVKKFYSGTVLSPENITTVEILGKKISFDVRGFFQSNLFALEKTIEQICKDLSGKNVLDMYAGCGTFSVFLADIFEKVTLIEHNRDAIVFAEQNLQGTNHESFGLSGEKWIQTKPATDFDAVVIDPPRSGMEDVVCKYLCETKIKKIRSVSCDPTTHARDAAKLIKAGYKLKKLFLLDFYPHTSHIESLAWFDYE